MKRVFPILLALSIITAPVMLYATIAAGSITTAKISAGAVTANEIAAGTITADRMNVTSLSAITGNMGTLTAGTITGGTIDGATIRAGSGDEVTLDTNGISLTGGVTSRSRVKWNDSSYVGVTTSNVLDVYGNGVIVFTAGSEVVNLNDSANALYSSVGTTLGASGANWGQLYGSTARFSTLAGTGSTSFVCTNNSGDIYPQATTCDGSAPAPTAADVAALRAELAELRTELARVAAASTR